MDFEISSNDGITYAVAGSNKRVCYNEQSALDLLMNAKYNAGTKNIIIDKSLVYRKFFSF
ncbi:MAG: DUF4180 domain-containing protein [Bacteroides sp.]|nr:DUF4180 domain-containing protein [Prevotella sp.]MCM1408143.1 DUF4180 domain-containing protein [Treponema brennaborense]MCM1469467.1 DUF4180 domain-containing protein [Bacteroides sp.]